MAQKGSNLGPADYDFSCSTVKKLCCLNIVSTTVTDKEIAVSSPARPIEVRFSSMRSCRTSSASWVCSNP